MHMHLSPAMIASLRWRIRHIGASFVLGAALLALQSSSAAEATEMPVRATQSIYVHHRIDLVGVRLHYVVAGSGAPVLLLHGFPENWATWDRIMPRLAGRYTLVAPDLPGMGDSGRRASGYDDATVADLIAQLVMQLGYQQVRVIGHDVGSHVAYALARRHSDLVSQLVLLDAIIPGIPPYDELTRNPRLWFWNFIQVQDLPEAMIGGRERVFLSWFYKSAAYDIAAVEPYIDIAAKNFAEAGVLRGSIAYIRAYPEDAKQNADYANHKLLMPVLALGGQFGNGSILFDQMKLAATDVQGGVMEQCGHWVQNERPDDVATRLLAFFARP